MSNIAADHTGARVGATGLILTFAVAATLAVCPGTVRAAVPKAGAWESGSRSDPRVSFDVRGPARARTVRRVSFPIACRDSPYPIGWASAVTVVRVRRDGRFAAPGGGAVIRGRFTSKHRAEVSVRGPDGDPCDTTRRYVVRHRGRRIAVRSGGFRVLVGGTASVGLELSAFGRVVLVQSMEGSVPATCADGSQRPLTLAGPDDVILAAPILPRGRFDISAADAGSGIRIAGAFDGASVAAGVEVTGILPDGTPCAASVQTLVGALTFPHATVGESQIFPGPPEIVLRPSAATES